MEFHRLSVEWLVIPDPCVRDPLVALPCSGVLSATDAARSTRCAQIFVTELGLCDIAARMGSIVQHTSRGCSVANGELRRMGGAEQFGPTVVSPLYSCNVYARWCGVRLEHPVPLEHAPQGHGGSHTLNSPICGA